LQSGFLLLGVILSIVAIANALNLDFMGIVRTVNESPYSQIFFWDWQAKSNFFKQFFSGAFIAIVMTGLDQNMMQKNLSCKSLGEAQKNIYWFSFVLIFVNLFFVSLGALLYAYATKMGIELPTKTDQLFPLLALNHLGIFAAIVFVLGITAATFSSADSVLTTLTTSFCIDFLGQNPDVESTKSRNTRHLVHITFAFLLLMVIIIFQKINNDAVINSVFTAAGYTYGPLLGLFGLGLFTNIKVKDRWVPIICIISPILVWIVDKNSAEWMGGYKFGFELLMLNGLITFIGLMMIRASRMKQNVAS
jgi:Na+/proline symporter